MAFETGGMSAADMAAVLRGGGYNNGWGNDGNCGWWIILFFILCLGGGWGNGGWGGNAPAQAVNADLQRGFDQQATTSQISQLQTQVGQGFADAAVARCQGDANITAAVTNSQFATAQAIGAAKDTLALGLNQMAMTNQQGFNDNRAGQADLKYTIATEACADRQAISDGLRDTIAQNTANTNAIIQNQTQGFQAIQDKLCQLEIDNLKAQNQELRSRIQMADLAASQTAQTAQLVQNAQAQTQAVISSCCPKPQPAYVVPNPNCGCGGLYGGCGA